MEYTTRIVANRDYSNIHTHTVHTGTLHYSTTRYYIALTTSSVLLLLHSEASITQSYLGLISKTR